MEENARSQPQVSEGNRVRHKYRQFQGMTITFDQRQILTCILKRWDNIVEILPFNFQGNRNLKMTPIRLRNTTMLL